MFQNARTVFTIYGIDVRIDPSWLLIAALFIWNLSVQYFPPILPEKATAIYVVMGVVATLGFFASLLLHELAHSLVAMRYGLKIDSITLFIFGGVAALKSDPKSARSEFWIAIAGPAMSLFLAFTGFTLAQFLASLGGSGALVEILAYLGLANLVLAIFNLVPAFPMDGGRVLRAAIWYLKSDLDYATDIAGKLGAFLGVAMIGLGLVSVLGGAGFSGFWLILIGFFVLNSSRGAVEMRRTERALSGRKVGDIMSQNPVTADEGLMLADLVDGVMLAHNVGFVPVLRGDHLLGVVDRAALMTVARANWPTTPVGDVVIRADATNTISPDIAVEDVLALMQSGGQRKFLVARAGRLVGVLSLSDVAHFIALEASLAR